MATAKKETAKAKAPAKPKAPAAPKVTYPLHEAVSMVVAKFESQAEAARQLGVGKAYLSRLMSGVKDSPSDEVLSKMNIRRLPAEYALLRKPAGQQA